MRRRSDSVMKSLYIPVDLLNELREIAKEEETSVNSLIITAIREYVERKRGEPNG